METAVKTELIGAVLKITLNRPERFNSFNTAMTTQLTAAIAEAKNNKVIRAVYITGEGRAFCAGQDLTEMGGKINGEEVTKSVHEKYNPMALGLRALEKPVVCAVNGVAAGAGANFALAGDVVIAAESASFLQAFSKIGLVPDCGGTYFLPRLIGSGKASALMMLGEQVSATDAEKMGMIYNVVEDDKLEEVAMKTAQKLAEAPTVGLGLTKRLLNESMNNTLAEQLHAEGVLQGEAAETSDFAEGVAAFVGKRKPEFKGE